MAVSACEGSFDRLAASIAPREEVGDECERAMALEELAHAHFVAGEMEASAVRTEESLTVHRAVGHRKLAVRAQLVLAHALVAQHDVARAEALAEEGLAFATAAGDSRSAYRAHHVLGDCAMVRDDCELAQRRFCDSLRLAWDRGDRFHACDELDGLAVALAACGDARRALVGICGHDSTYLFFVTYPLATVVAQELYDFGGRRECATGVDQALLWTGQLSALPSLRMTWYTHRAPS